MSETDALSTFDFNKVTKGGLYLKFEANKPLTLRILTTNPVVFTSVYTDKNTGEETVSTKFAFVVYNFTEDKAQILQASPNMAKKITDLHLDPDFGANIKNIDIKITPTGEKLERRYDIQVLPKTNTLTKEQVEACKAIDLDNKVDGDRLSIYDPEKYVPSTGDEEEARSGYEAAKAKSDSLKPGADKDIVIEDIPDEEPINLEDIPF